MDTDAILALLDGQYLLILGAVLLIIALVAIIKLRGSVHQLGQEHDHLTRRPPIPHRNSCWLNAGYLKDCGRSPGRCTTRSEVF